MKVKLPRPVMIHIKRQCPKILFEKIDHHYYHSEWPIVLGHNQLLVVHIYGDA